MHETFGNSDESFFGISGSAPAPGPNPAARRSPAGQPDPVGSLVQHPKNAGV